MKTSDWPHASELTHEEWRDRLRHYVRRSDRTAEPVFVGREDIFERVGDCIEKARDRDKVANLTIIVSGAPGAGKSAFIAECMRRCAERGSAVPVELDHDGLWPDKLASGIGEALSLPKETPARTSRSLQVSVGLPDGPSATIGTVFANRNRRIDATRPGRRRGAMADNSGRIRQGTGDEARTLVR